MLIEKSIAYVIPFAVLFMLYNCLFAMEFYILQSNKDDAAGYSGLGKAQTFVGYFFVAFENGIGNISPPSVEVWNTSSKNTTSSQVIMYLIYLFWFLNQVILLIFLLNFVIALISE